MYAIVTKMPMLSLTYICFQPKLNHSAIKAAVDRINGLYTFFAELSANFHRVYRTSSLCLSVKSIASGGTSSHVLHNCI